MSMVQCHFSFEDCRQFIELLPTNMKKICPTCRGIGYFEECPAPEEKVAENWAVSSIGSQAADSKEENMIRILSTGGNVCTDNSHKIHSPSRKFSAIGGGDERLDPGFLADPDKFENFQGTLRLSIQKLKQNNWDDSVSAVLNIVDVSRIHPEMVDSSMPLVTRSLCSLLKNVRLQVVRTACQIAEELFKTMQCTSKPEFDELVFALLRKTAHTYKNVREDANRALDAMTTYIPPSHCISAMSTSNCAGNKNSVVRTTVSRLLYDVVYGVGLETFLMSSNLREARRKTFIMCIEFLNDPCIETRGNARRLVQLLMRHEEFNAVLNQDVQRSLIKKIEKQLIALKYDFSDPS